MTVRRPLVIVTVPGRTVAEVRSEIASARDAGADAVEIRFDRWESKELSAAGALFPSPVPLVATIRSRAEGGEGPDAEEPRARLLESLGAYPFRWMDLEAARDGALAGRLPPPAQLGRILSTHLPETASLEDVARLLQEVAPPGAIRKVVLPASVDRVLRELLPLVVGAKDREVALMTTGPSGALLRAWSQRLGLPLVYARPADSESTGAPSVEPSQIPIDRLVPFLSADEEAPLFAILGHPIGHSRSPRLHSRWMRSARRAGLYIALDIESESEFVESLDPLADGGFRGLNVTHPWKAAARDVATRVGPGAETVGAANCLTFTDGEIEAENTDLAAVLRRLDELRQSGGWDGSELAVVGAGGAAAATLAAVRELGATAYVFARDGRRALAISEQFGAKLGLRPEARPFPLVVHATDVGRAGAGALEVPLAELTAAGTTVLDWVYAADDPTIRVTTEGAGGRYEDGWRLLVYQAAASFGIWWGSEPSVDEVSAVVREGPCTA
ncbi:MAG: type I 3-dehydroquinate dehydratase [Thermoplasmata archaeon]